jgi:hypothetical protein
MWRWRTWGKREDTGSFLDAVKAVQKKGAEERMKKGDGHVKKVRVNKRMSVEAQNQARLVKTGNTGN